ncbi:acyl-CoA thioesterase [Neisseria zoodegmatis]|uniref:1,4-dihydroxy-2-naphthoyl-CoA hydrolase n=1 Tax=Neisseria zoodegmatis TaxID=326523 RepID=A0AB38DT70_9NEIS|nr:thioesterase family protein [Neisseria zoodegmatis]OSI11131.1 esterase [Neisseria zoodegmatis]SNU80590.1 1,4-dihydroxy-2-naphthoyl-CoA hydrolase [Neisseria zoodegmatis]
MPRISVPRPAKAVFRTSVTVQIGDINYGNHLANDAVLRICHECRIRWLAQHGFTELDAGGAGLIMADAAVQYLAQAHHRDMLDVIMDVTDITRSGFTLLYDIRRADDQRAIAAVQTGMVCFDYGTQKISRLPESLRAVCEAV